MKLYLIYVYHWYCSTLNLRNPCYRFHQTLYTDYSGLEWSNINTFWYLYGKYDSIADGGRARS